MKKINMKGMRKLSITATAMVAAAVMALAGCGSSNSSSSSSSSASTSGTKTSKFVLGGLWPETGSLAYLAPPELAAEKLAVKDINDGWRRARQQTSKPPSTPTPPTRTTPTRTPLPPNPSSAKNPSVHHRSGRPAPWSRTPTSPGHLRKTFRCCRSGATSARPSPALATTSSAPSPPDTVQGAVMGNLIAQDGVQKLAIAVFNDEYGTGPARHHRQNRRSDGRRRTSSMAKRTRSTRPKRTSHPSPPPSRPSNPDATLVIAFDQTKPLAEGARRRRSLNTKKLYFDRRQHRPTIPAELRRGPAGRLEGHHPGYQSVRQLRQAPRIHRRRPEKHHHLRR